MPTRRPRFRRRSLAALAALAAINTLFALPHSHADEVLVETIELDSADPDGVVSTTALDPAKTYRFEISGQYTYSSAIGLYLADAECSQTTGDTRWRDNRWGNVLTPDDPKDDPLDVYVDGEPVVWRPVKGTESNDGKCSPDAHLYEYEYAATGAPVGFRVYDLGNQDNLLKLTIKIFETVTEQLVAVATIQATDLDGDLAQLPDLSGPYEFQQGRTYRIEASSTYQYSGGPGLLADAECTTAGADWQEDRYSLLVTPFDPFDDVLDLYVDNVPVDWIPMTDPDGNGCDEQAHAYRHTFIPAETKPVRFTIYDNTYTDNAGALEIRVYLTSVSQSAQELPVEVTPPPVPSPDPTALAEEVEKTAKESAAIVVTPPATEPLTGDPDLLETQVARAVVDASAAAGARAKELTSPNDFTFEAGKTYRLEVTGTYQYSANGIADAECSRDVNSLPGQRQWEPNRFGVTMTPLDPQDDPLDLMVGSSYVTWAPLHDDGYGCDPDTHTYEYVLTPAATGPIAFKVYEFSYGDNVGTLTVDVYQADEQLLETVVVNTRTEGGAVTVNELEPDRSYRFYVAGTYLYTGAAAAEADAECSRAGGNDWITDRYQPILGTAHDWLDLEVEGQSVVWGIPGDETVLDPDGDGCNEVDHSYDWRMPAGTLAEHTQVRLAVRDPGVFDNAGVLVVKIYACVGASGCE